MVIEFPPDETELFDEVLTMYQGPKTRHWDAMVALLADAQKHAEGHGMDWSQMVEDGKAEREEIAASAGVA